MEKWLKEGLSHCLCFEVPDEMISYIMTIKGSSELEGYFKTLLDFDMPEHVEFYNDFRQRMKKSIQPNESKNKKSIKPVVSKKNETVQKPKFIPLEEVKPEPVQPIYTGAKKKTKYVNMYGQDGELKEFVLLKGRNLCDCQAAKHKLVNNCIHCGRIVCEQEGSGPCLFCGSLVCTEEEQRLIDSSSKKGDNLKKSLMGQNRPKGWEEAVATRNRLLEYERNSEKRTTVIDDESDYFKTNSVWLSDTEKKKLERLENEMRDRKHSSRLNRKITIDFSGRQIVEEPQLTIDIEDEILTSIAQSMGPSGHDNYGNNNQIFDLSDDVHPGITGPPPIFDESVAPPIQRMGKNNSFNPHFDGVFNKVQDKEFLEMSDLKHCISMHQPWASLLVAGIKMHEGRSWYSSHRGRLWIAATAKPVDIGTVKQMENTYKILYNDDSIEFPSQYPSACLLGCVSVQDCLPQEEYRKMYPDGESDCPFVFICTDPQELPIRFPVKGQHKIYNLDTKIHQAAVKSLQRLSKLKAGE